MNDETEPRQKTYKELLDETIRSSHARRKNPPLMHPCGIPLELQDPTELKDKHNPKIRFESFGVGMRVMTNRTTVFFLHDFEARWLCEWLIREFCEGVMPTSPYSVAQKQISPTPVPSSPES